MPARTSAAQNFELFEHAQDGMAERLRGVRAPAKIMSALRWGAEELDQAYATAPARVLARVACRVGCTSCCSVPVDASAHEVFLAADHIQTHFSPAALTVILARLGRHRARVAGYEEGERPRSRQACALLKAGACSIYAARPGTCRSHHTSDVTWCDANKADASVNVTKVYLPVLRDRMAAVMYGVDAALGTAGYDERGYDFGSALHEALTNSLCLVRWLRRRPAFPDSCLVQL